MARSSFADLPLRDKGLVVVALPVAALLVAVIALGLVQNQQQAAAAEVHTTLELLTELHRTQTIVVDAETAMRAYALTRDAEWLAPYEAARRQLAPALDRLQRLIGGQPTYAARLRRVREYAVEKFGLLDRLRELARGSPRAEALEAALAQGRDSRDAFREALAAIERDETRLLRARQAREQGARIRMYRLIGISIAIGLLGGVIAALLFSSGIVKRVDLLRENARLLAQRRPLRLAPPSADEIGKLEEAISGADGLLRRREQELLETQLFLSHLIETSPTLIFQQDPATMAVTYVSPNVERILGCTPAEVMAVPNFWLEQIHPDDRARVLAEDRETLFAQTGQVETEYRLRRKDGAYRWFRSFVRLEYDEGGGLINILGHRLDITARKQAEQDLLDRQVSLDAANRELEAFSYSVSHDLRAPLRSIDGFSLALLEEYQDRLDATGRDYLKRVRAATQRMGALIDDLLKLSRVTRVPLHREEVCLSAMADNIAQQLQQTQPEREVDWKIQPELAAVGDPGLLGLVLENLLGNAWKFTARRKRAQIEFGAYPRGPGRLVYFVRDNGAGFDQAYADKLFGAFQRLHAMQEFAGTGIGLATVARIVRRHGGQVWAEGVVDQGAVFSFTLQLEDVPPLAAHGFEDSSSQG